MMNESHPTPFDEEVMDSAPDAEWSDLMADILDSDFARVSPFRARNIVDDALKLFVAAVNDCDNAFEGIEYPDLFGASLLQALANERKNNDQASG